MDNRLIKTSWLALLIAVIAITAADAKQLYKWKDKDGIWHFADQPPVTDQPFESKPLRVDPRPRLQMRKIGLKNKPGYKFLNNLYGPMEIEVQLTEVKNILSDPPLPRRFVLESRQEKTLVSLQPADPRSSWSFRIASRYMPGSPNASHDSSVSYLPPFPGRDRYPISQGFNGTETHTEDHARYAVDIAMPIGTPVLAARDGIVMDVEDDFFGGGTDRKRFGDRANIIRILHVDGTMSVYAHLKLDSIRVSPGKPVLVGEQIAESGNTGFSSGPHLHFAVQRNAGMNLISIPFEFKGPNGSRVTPDRAMMLGGVN